MKVKVLSAQTQLEIREIDLPETVAQHGECSFGRSPNSALVLDSPDVSRLHGKFRLEQGQYYFYDLGSANGSTINGQLAQANHGYVLKSGDIIRVGEFVLLLHEISLEDLPATVIGDPNATVISRFQSGAIAPPVQSPLLEVPELDNTAAIADPIPEEAPILAETPEELSEDFVEPPEIATESIDLPVQEEEPETPSIELDQIDELATEPMLAEATTDLQLTEADSTTIQLSEPDEPATEAIDDVEPALTDSTTIQLPDEPPEEVIAVETPADSTLEPEAIGDVELALTDSTTIQLSEPDEPVTEAIDDVEPALTDSTVIQLPDESIAVETPALIDSTLEPEAIDDVEPALTDSTVIQLPDEPLEEAVAVETPALIDSTPATEAINVEPAPIDSIPVEEPQTALDEPIEEAIAVEPLEEVPRSESVDNIEEALEADPWEDSLPVTDSSIEEVPEDRTILQTSEPLEQLEDLFTEPIIEEPTIVPTSESLEQPISEITSTPEVEPEEPALDEIEPAIAITADNSIDQPESIAELTPSEPETPAAEKLPIAPTKYIALLANDSQIEELEQLVDRYQDLLKQCKTIATPTVSDALRHSLRFTISQQTPAVSSGGYQTINTLITSDQVLAVIFLRDFLAPQPTQVNDDALSRSCNVYRVLFATNAPTADALLHYIQTVVATR
ncbi:FHA domain-containing protein [Cyanobacteria bacterium FACHB-63]|nr:FHA domain-containing protein [Cyanobacteria bacterium FACHB-63]